MSGLAQYEQVYLAMHDNSSIDKTAVQRKAVDTQPAYSGHRHIINAALHSGRTAQLPPVLSV
jgi:hypothetical protein